MKDKSYKTTTLFCLLLLLLACMPSGLTSIATGTPEQIEDPVVNTVPTDTPDVQKVDRTYYTLSEKIDNRPTIPVFYPWASLSPSGVWCGETGKFNFDCDTDDSPYSLVWTETGAAREIKSTKPIVPTAQSNHMRLDEDTLFLVEEKWHYWSEEESYLSPNSKFYLDELFEFHVMRGITDTRMINFEHPEWPDVMVEKALSYKIAGFDGMIFDWWHNWAGNGRNPEDVEIARIAIAKAIREKVGTNFILMCNVNERIDDPTAQYLSGVFLELAKDPSEGYVLTYDDENKTKENISIERMEDVLKYWDTKLQWPKIIAFEPWKITTGDYIDDRYSEENYQYAKLFTAMGVVIPENGYILYSDNNPDWDGGDHQHAYYDFYHTDFGKPTSGMVQVVEGVAYKQFEEGIIVYNRTASEVEVTLPHGKQFKIGPVEGLFLEEE